MVIHTWGFVDTRPGSPWTKIELRAERGAILRVSGTTYSAAMACLARVRSALQSLEVRWPGKALTLHVHPACNAAQYFRPMATLLPARGHEPQCAESVWLAPNATVVGEVTLGEHSTVWFSAVVRGDVAPIQVGERVNIQDGAVIHGTFNQSHTVLEDDVSVGHNAIVHGAHVQQGALIGMGSVVMDHVVVGAYAVVAAGAVVLAGTQIGEGELWAGVPAKCRGQVSEELRAHLSTTSERYVEYAGWFQDDQA